MRIRTGSVIAFQTSWEFVRWNPHWHEFQKYRRMQGASTAAMLSRGCVCRRRGFRSHNRTLVCYNSKDHGENKVRKRIAVAAVLAVLLAASTYAQTTDFFEFVKTGTSQSVQAAINQGADVNAQDKMGWTPLMCAAQYNPDSTVVATLLEAGANLNARNKYGWVSLMYGAASNRNPEVVEALLKAGAQVNVRDRYGLTPLMSAACLNQNPDVITILLKAGANGKAKSNEGKTAFDYAQDNEKLKDTDTYWKLNEAQY